MYCILMSIFLLVREGSETLFVIINQILSIAMWKCFVQIYLLNLLAVYIFVINGKGIDGDV